MDETKKPVNNPAGAESELNAGLGKDLSKMRDASYLLPSPIGEVVRELLDEIERLRRASEPVAWRHETTCEFISDEMKREFPDTLFIRKCNIPLFGEPVIGTTEAVISDVILRKQIDAQNVALQDAREEYAMLKDQFDKLNKITSEPYGYVTGKRPFQHFQKYKTDNAIALYLHSCQKIDLKDFTDDELMSEIKSRGFSVRYGITLHDA